ncbi:hypothetical protein L1987_09209 [Smallanthus sonchifolius]|uniref:Uncharacterized protein n=1 Tax=Smallanthus sonchifolius TaxID=185202 RepID=A0ACB9JMU9_9ASTR|nr:hypothetical protein L1987_09209 [Smallanthus sonchifolius]
MFDFGKTKKEKELCDSSEVRKVFQNELPTATGKELDFVLKEIDDTFKIRDSDIGEKVTEREVVATLEVNNTTEPKKAIGGGEELDPVLKKIDDAFKITDIDMGEKGIESQLVCSLDVSKNTEGEKISVEGKGSEVNENNDTDKLSEICLGEGLQMKDREESDKTDLLLHDEDNSMGMENSMDEESKNKKERDICGKAEKKNKKSGEKRKRNDIEWSESSKKSIGKGKKLKKEKDGDDNITKKGKEVSGRD